MSKASRARRRLGSSLFVLPLIVGLGGCLDDSGYPAVINREKDPFPIATNPPPPPIRGGAIEPQAEVVAANLPPGVTQEMVNAGQNLYGTVCAACHGAAGEGGPVAPALNDAEWLNIAGGFEEIVQIIHTGVPTPRQFPGGMPPMGGGSFTEEQVRELAAYVYALANQEGA